MIPCLVIPCLVIPCKASATFPEAENALPALRLTVPSRLAVRVTTRARYDIPELSIEVQTDKSGIPDYAIVSVPFPFHGHTYCAIIPCKEPKTVVLGVNAGSAVGLDITVEPVTVYGSMPTPNTRYTELSGRIFKGVHIFDPRTHALVTAMTTSKEWTDFFANLPPVTTLALK